MKNLITIDTSAILAVLLEEPEKARLVELTRGMSLIAPFSLPWEIGNALSLILKKKRLGIDAIMQVLAAFDKVAIDLKRTELRTALDLAHRYDLYAYDAYMLACAQDHGTSLLTLDRRLAATAKNCHIKILEV